MRVAADAADDGCGSPGSTRAAGTTGGGPSSTSTAGPTIATRSARRVTAGQANGCVPIDGRRVNADRLPTGKTASYGASGDTADGGCRPTSATCAASAASGRPCSAGAGWTTIAGVSGDRIAGSSTRAGVTRNR
jgi:hypothetical protein